MATGTYAPDPDLRVVDANGVPVSGGLVWTYIAGTLTPTPTYTDVGLLVPNTNPIVAGSDGRFVAFLAGGISYKFVYEMPAVPPAHGAVIATRDNILAVTSIAAGSGGGVEQTIFNTGTINDLPLVAGCSILYCNGASPLTITGLSGGAPGQRVTVVARGAQVNLAYMNTGSLAPNRLFNVVSSAATSITTSGGTATYVYDSSYQRWTLVTHDQGAWITEPFNAATYSAAGGTWTVGSPAVLTNVYKIAGQTLFWNLYLSWFSGSNVLSAGATSLKVTLPGGYSGSASGLGVGQVVDAGAVINSVVGAVSGVTLTISKMSGNFTGGSTLGLMATWSGFKSPSSIVVP